MRPGLRGRLARPAVVAAVLIAAAFVSACGSSTKTIARAKVERAIANSIAREHGLYANVLCPANVAQRSGYEFTCTARLQVGDYPVTVTEVDGNGNVRYESGTPLITLDVAKVQRAIETSVLSQRGVHATASCPAEVRQEQGLSFRCSASVRGSAGSYPFTVSQLDDAGHVSYVGT